MFKHVLKAQNDLSRKCLQFEARIWEIHLLATFNWVQLKKENDLLEINSTNISFPPLSLSLSPNPPITHILSLSKFQSTKFDHFFPISFFNSVRLKSFFSIFRVDFRAYFSGLFRCNFSLLLCFRLAFINFMVYYVANTRDSIW